MGYLYSTLHTAVWSFLFLGVPCYLWGLGSLLVALPVTVGIAYCGLRGREHVG